MELKHDDSAPAVDVGTRRGSLDHGNQQQQQLDEQSTAQEHTFKRLLRRYQKLDVTIEQYKMTVEVLLRGGTRIFRCSHHDPCGNAGV